MQSREVQHSRAFKKKREKREKFFVVGVVVVFQTDYVTSSSAMPVTHCSVLAERKIG